MAVAAASLSVRLPPIPSLFHFPFPLWLPMFGGGSWKALLVDVRVRVLLKRTKDLASPTARRPR